MAESPAGIFIFCPHVNGIGHTFHGIELEGYAITVAEHVVSVVDAGEDFIVCDVIVFFPANDFMLLRYQLFVNFNQLLSLSRCIFFQILYRVGQMYVASCCIENRIDSVGKHSVPIFVGIYGCIEISVDLSSDKMYFNRIFFFRVVEVVIHIGKSCPFRSLLYDVNTIFKFEPFKMETPILIALIGSKEFCDFHSQFTSFLQPINNDNMFPRLKYNTCHMLICTVSVSNMQKFSQCFWTIYRFKGIHAKLCIISPTM